MPEIEGRELDQLPDSSFAIILPGGRKDEEGKTVPRQLRLLPFRDGAGEVMMGLVHKSLTALNSTRFIQVSKDQKVEAWSRIISAADAQVRKDERRFERGGFFPPPRKF